MGNEQSGARQGGGSGSPTAQPSPPAPARPRLPKPPKEPSLYHSSFIRGAVSLAAGPRPPSTPHPHQRATLGAPPSSRAAVKLVVRGARGVGKTSLLARLKGQPVPPEYAPTPEIQTASIAWVYKNADDKIEVEVWDVVDRALSEEQLRGEVDDDDAPAGALQPLRAPLPRPPPLLRLTRRPPRPPPPFHTAQACLAPPPPRGAPAARAARATRPSTGSTLTCTRARTRRL